MTLFTLYLTIILPTTHSSFFTDQKRLVSCHCNDDIFTTHYSIRHNRTYEFFRQVLRQKSLLNSLHFKVLCSNNIYHFDTTPNTTLKSCLLHSPRARALLRQQLGIRRPKGGPMAGILGAGIGACHRSSLYPRRHSKRLFMHDPNNGVSIGRAPEPTVQPRPFVDPLWQQTSLSKKSPACLITTLRPRALLSMCPHT